MPATVHRPLKIIAFSADGVGRQSYEFRKHLQDIKIDMALFSETHLKSHMRFYIPYYDIYRTDLDYGHKNETAIAVKKGILHTCTDIPLFLPVDAAGICIPIGNSEMLLAAVYKSPQRLWSDASITELLGFRNKFILADNLNAKHPICNSKCSDSSGLKLLESFVSSGFKIAAPQCSMHCTAHGRYSYIIVLQNVRLSGVIVTDILGPVRVREALDPVEKLTDWELFQSVASQLVSLNIQIHSSNEADKAARDFAASVASAYRILTRTTTVLDCKYEIPGLGHSLT
jgi:hypothetical protein